MKKWYELLILVTATVWIIAGSLTAYSGDIDGAVTRFTLAFVLFICADIMGNIK